MLGDAWRCSEMIGDDWRCILKGSLALLDSSGFLRILSEFISLNLSFFALFLLFRISYVESEFSQNLRRFHAPSTPSPPPSLSLSHCIYLSTYLSFYPPASLSFSRFWDSLAVLALVEQIRRFSPSHFFRSLRPPVCLSFYSFCLGSSRNFWRS